MSAKSPVLDAPARDDPLGPGSDRTFGFFFAAVFVLAGGYGLWHAKPWGWTSVAIGVALAVLAAIAPRALHLPNRLWFGLGMLLARIVNPIVIGLMFFIVITPMGWLMRAAGKRPLSLGYEPALPSYWVERKPHGPAPETMRNQF